MATKTLAKAKKLINNPYSVIKNDMDIHTIGYIFRYELDTSAAKNIIALVSGKKSNTGCPSMAAVAYCKINNIDIDQKWFDSFDRYINYKPTCTLVTENEENAPVEKPKSNIKLEAPEETGAWDAYDEFIQTGNLNIKHFAPCKSLNDEIKRELSFLNAPDNDEYYAHLTKFQKKKLIEKFNQIEELTKPVKLTRTKPIAGKKPKPLRIKLDKFKWLKESKELNLKSKSLAVTKFKTVALYNIEKSTLEIINGLNNELGITGASINNIDHSKSCKFRIRDNIKQNVLDLIQSGKITEAKKLIKTKPGKASGRGSESTIILWIK